MFKIREPEQFNEIIRRLYKSAMDPQEWEQLLPKFIDYFYGAISATVEQNLQTGRARAIQGIGMDSKALAEYSAYYGPRSQAFQDFSVYEQGTIVHDELLKDYASYQSSETFEFLRKHQGEHLMAMVIEKNPHWMTYLVLRRPGSRGRFTEEERELAKHLMPHLIQANHIARQFQRKNIINQALSNSFDHFRHGIVILEKPGTAIYHNQAADTVFSRNDGLSFRQGQFTCLHSQDKHCLEQAISNAFQLGAENATEKTFLNLKIKRTLGHRSYHLSIAPLVHEVLSSNEGRPMVLITLHDPDNAAIEDLQALSNYYQLTATEAQVTQRLCQGHSVAAIANQLEISNNAVRFHLKNIFQKLHINKQTELVSLILSGPLAQISVLPPASSRHLN